MATAESPTSSTTSPTSPTLRIGILGAANIARKNIRAIQHPFNTQTCKLVAIASRSESKVIPYVKEHIQTDLSHDEEVKVFTGTNAYMDLISSRGIVDALYIPLPTSLHCEYVKAALDAGKHVLVEKPVSTTIEEYNAMIDVANKNQKFIMDGTMFVHNPRTNDIISEIRHQSNLVGEEKNVISRIQSDFTFSGDEHFFNNNIRISSKGDLLGCIGDLGWYCIRMAQLVFFPCQATSAQVVHVEVNKDGVPIDATCIVTFNYIKNNNQDVDDQARRRKSRILSFHCSFLHPLNQSISIFGSKYSIHMDDFVIPRKEEAVVAKHVGVDKEESSSSSSSTPSQEQKQKVLYHEKSQSLSFADLYSVHVEEVKKSTNVDGTPQEVLMWSNFAKYCKAVDENVEASVKEGKDLLDFSYQNQCIVSALMDSLRREGEKVAIHN